MHILVVDDDIPTVEVIRTSLHWDLLGIDRVETAYDYTEAQNKICASQPDIILCDIEMPRGSGLDLLRWLREEKRDCEFVFLTCHANFDYAKTALQYGAADYITKPFNIAQTEATLSKVASQVRYHQELLQKSRAGQQWEEAHSLAQASFLHGLFMDGTLMTEIELNKRFQDLGLAVDALQPIHIVLATAPQPADDTSWKPELFGYAFRNLATELLCENAPRPCIPLSAAGYALLPGLAGRQPDAGYCSPALPQPDRAWRQLPAVRSNLLCDPQRFLAHRSRPARSHGAARPPEHYPPRRIDFGN